MIELDGFALLRPLWLLGLPLIGLPYLLRRVRGQLPGWPQAVDPVLLQAMSRLRLILPGEGGGRWIAGALLCTVVVALAGPALRQRQELAFHNLDGVVIAIDLSRSVAEGGGLSTAVSAGRMAAELAAGRPTGLILFAGDAYLASPLTTDAQALGATIAALDGETVPDPGSCVRCALSLARETLANAQTLASDIVLISDGGGAEAAMAELDALRRAGARVSTLYVAPSARGERVPAPDPAALGALAARGGGSAGEAARSADVLNAVSGSGPSLGDGDLTLLVYQDYGRHLLVLALPFAFLLLRGRA